MTTRPLHMLALLVVAWLAITGLSRPAMAAPHLAAQLVAENPAPSPGSTTTLAIALAPEPGWHGYWSNPGDAGTPPDIRWTLPQGVTVGALRYPVPQQLVISGLMNHVYERDYAMLARMEVAAHVAPGTRLPIRASARWLVCSDTLCVPEQAELALDLIAGPRGAPTVVAPRFDQWRAAQPRPLGTIARYEIKGDQVRIAIPYPASAPITAPHFFAITRDLVDYATPQHWGRNGDLLVAELSKARFFTASPQLTGILATGPDQGLDITAVPGPVPPLGTPISDVPSADNDPISLWLALGGAVLGGLLLNLMPCVFPILSLKAMSLIRAGASENEARREGLAYLLGAMLGTTGLGGLLLAIRASGEEAGWAFQLQYPATILVLFTLMALMTANLAGWVHLPALVTGQSVTRREGAWGALATGALAAFVATPCTGPFLGAALGAALVLPTGAALAVFAGLGLGIALPFVAIGFVPALRTRLPKPGGWMERVKHWLAVPMALTALGLMWLLWRQAGLPGLGAGVAILMAGALLIRRQQGFASPMMLVLGFAASLALGLALGLALPDRVNGPSGASASHGEALAFNEDRLAGLRAKGQPVFLYFTADWCITCKVNEAAAIDRAEVRRHFKDQRIIVMIGDWTRGDPAITRFLERQGRSGVPLYLYYPPRGDAQLLPQLLTADMLLALD